MSATIASSYLNTNALNNIELADALAAVLRVNLVPYVAGSPGMGKSAVIHSVAAKFNLKVIDIRLSQVDPTVLDGFMIPNAERTAVVNLPLEMFPVENTPLPQRIVDGVSVPYSGWLIFFDELPSAPAAVQKAAYKVLLDRMVGQAHLHSNVRMAAAGNLRTDNAMVGALGTATQSRLIHLEMRSDTAEWLNWANSNGVDHRVTSYLANFKDRLNRFSEMNSKNQITTTFPCERTWDFVSKLITGVADITPIIRTVIAGAIGAAPAQEFFAFLQNYANIPAIDEIIAAPATAQVPDKNPGALHAVVGMVAAHMHTANIAPLIEYINRLSPEYQYVAMQQSQQRNPMLLADPSAMTWITSNTHLIV